MQHVKAARHDRQPGHHSRNNRTRARAEPVRSNDQAGRHEKTASRDSHRPQHAPDRGGSLAPNRYKPATLLEFEGLPVSETARRTKDAQTSLVSPPSFVASD